MCCSSADDAQVAPASASVHSIDAVSGRVAAGPQIQGRESRNTAKALGISRAFAISAGGGEAPAKLSREKPQLPRFPRPEPPANGPHEIPDVEAATAAASSRGARPTSRPPGVNSRNQCNFERLRPSSATLHDPPDHARSTTRRTRPIGST